LLISRIGDDEQSRKRKLDEFEIFIRDSIGLDIIHKIQVKTKNYMNDIVYSRNPFGFVSSERGCEKSLTNTLRLYSSGGIGYVSADSVTKNKKLISKYKVYIGKVNPDRGGVNNAKDGKMNVITKVNVISPFELITETYLLLGVFDKKVEAINCASYYRTKFVRILISLTLTSMNITKDNFQFVPLQDFSKPWTDEELYKKYGLTDEEIQFIESMIRPME
jgi:site-specific DNA-methyltransferase (adenine-specific)